MRLGLPHLFVFLALILSIPAESASAVTLNWDAVAWANGSKNGSFEIDAASPGNDITVAVTESAGVVYQNEIAAPNPLTPARFTAFQGGLGATENTLAIAVDLASNAAFVTVTVTLSAQYTAGVHSLSFSLFDIDFANASGNTYQDQLRNITGLSYDGVTQIAPTITTSVNNTLTGSGLTQVITGTASTVDTGAGSGNGNVRIDFGANAIKSFTFTYGSGTTFANPTYQHVGLHDITFTPVPEINPAWSAVFSCVAAAGLIFRHRANFRK